MAEPPARASTSVDAILAGARRVITERGPGRFTMSAVAAAAGVSRPTLYRWFPTKDELLTALSAYEVQQFDLRLAAVIEAQPTPSLRLDSAVRFLVTYLDGLMGPDPIGVDPGFALQSLAASLGSQVESFVRLLGDGLDAVPAVRRGRLTRAEAAEVFLRLAYSHYLVPHRDPDALIAAVGSFTGLPSRSLSAAR